MSNQALEEAARGATPVQIGPRFVDDFNGDTDHLLSCMDALLKLHAEGALSHPVPGLARQLLNNAGARLEAVEAQSRADKARIAELEGENGSLRHELECLRHQVGQLEYPCSLHCEGYLRELAMRNGGSRP